MQLDVEFPSDSAAPSLKGTLFVQLGCAIDKGKLLGQKLEYDLD